MVEWNSSLHNRETIHDYERLRRYVEKVLRNDPELHEIVAVFERKQRDGLRIGRK
jgi:hypothetical protein